MASRLTFDFTPVTDADYDAARVSHEIDALEGRYDGLIPPSVQDRIRALRSGAVRLPPASLDQLRHDRERYADWSRQWWRFTKNDARRARGLWARSHRSAAQADADWFSQQAIEVERGAVQRARSWRHCRMMIAYLDARIAAASSVGSAA